MPGGVCAHFQTEGQHKWLETEHRKQVIFQKVCRKQRKVSVHTFSLYFKKRQNTFLLRSKQALMDVSCTMEVRVDPPVELDV